MEKVLRKLPENDQRLAEMAVGVHLADCAARLVCPSFQCTHTHAASAIADVDDYDEDDSAEASVVPVPDDQLVRAAPANRARAFGSPLA